jgi:hypothetical protein
MRLNKDKPSVIGASAQVDHKPTDDLSVADKICGSGKEARNKGTYQANHKHNWETSAG